MLWNDVQGSTRRTASCACEECLHRSALPGRHCLLAPAMRSYCGPRPARAQAGTTCQLYHLHQLQTKQSNHPSSALPTRQVVPIVRLLEYELLTTSPTLQTIEPLSILPPLIYVCNILGIILISLPASALSSWTLR